MSAWKFMLLRMFHSIAGSRLGAGGRHLPDPWPAVQAHRLDRLLLHPAGGHAADLRANGQTVGFSAAERGRRRRRVVKRLAGS